MAAIEITRQVNEPINNDLEATLISAFKRNSMTFEFNHGGITGSYATVTVNGTEFRATYTGGTGTPNVDSYYFDFTNIFPLLLQRNYEYISDDLSLNIIIVCKGYDSSGTELASATHITLQISYMVTDIGANTNDNTFVYGSNRVQYHNGLISFYWRYAAGTYPLSINGVSHNYYVRGGYNYLGLTFLQKVSGVFGNVSSGRTFDIPLVYKDVVGERIEWINKEGGVSSWNFRRVTKSINVENDNEIPLYFETNGLTTAKKRTLSKRTEYTYLFDTIAVNDDHYSQLCEIAESPHITLGNLMMTFVTCSNVISPCKQKLKFNLTLSIEQNAVSY